MDRGADIEARDYDDKMAMQLTSSKSTRPPLILVLLFHLLTIHRYTLSSLLMFSILTIPLICHNPTYRQRNQGVFGRRTKKSRTKETALRGLNSSKRNVHRDVNNTNDGAFKLLLTIKQIVPANL